MDMMTSRQVCQQLGIRDYQLLYLHTQQKVPEVRRLGCVRSYTAEDLEAIRRVVEAEGTRGRRRGRPKQPRS